MTEVMAVVLGIMQDGGLPHAGCRCERCAAAFADPGRSQYAACLAIVDSRQQPAGVWLIDATPDLKFQLHLLADWLGSHPRRPGRIRPPDAIFLTHGHLGHTLGLAYFGPEVMAVDQLPVYAPAGLVRVLAESRLWQPAIQRLELKAIDFPLSLAPDLTIQPIPVPHRDEWAAGTFAYRLTGPNRSLLYLPDIDSWEQWVEARPVLAGVDLALVDGSFYSLDELGGRPPVAHPLIPDTLRLWVGCPGRLYFTHLNHTNPALDPHSLAYQTILAAGADLVHTGQQFQL